MQRVLTPAPIFRYYRCADCADRYPAIGFGEHRIVVQHRTQEIVMVGSMVVIVAVLIAALMGFFALR